MIVEATTLKVTTAWATMHPDIIKKGTIKTVIIDRAETKKVNITAFMILKGYTKMNLKARDGFR